YTLWDTGLKRERAERQCGQRCLRRGLEHNRVASSQRWADLPQRHHQRIVPRGKLAADANWLAADDTVVSWHILLRGAAIERARSPGEEAQTVDGKREIAIMGELHRLADVARFKRSEIVQVLLQ